MLPAPRVLVPCLSEPTLSPVGFADEQPGEPFTADEHDRAEATAHCDAAATIAQIGLLSPDMLEQLAAALHAEQCRRFDDTFARLHEQSERMKRSVNAVDAAFGESATFPDAATA